MYTVAGIVMNSSTYCANTICTGLTEEELHFLLYGPDHKHFSYRNEPDTMDRWPRRAPYAYYDDNETDDDGNILYDENVVVTDALRPRDRDGEITIFLDDGSFEDGCYCDHCSEVLIKPYTILCHFCKDPAAEGSFALTLEAKKLVQDLPCASCIDRHFTILLAAIEESLQEELDGNEPTYAAFLQTYKELTHVTPGLAGYLQKIDDAITTYCPEEADYARSRALETVSQIAHDFVDAWEEAFDTKATVWEEMRERYREEWGQ